MIIPFDVVYAQCAFAKVWNRLQLANIMSEVAVLTMVTSRRREECTHSMNHAWKCELKRTYFVFLYINEFRSSIRLQKKLCA